MTQEQLLILAILTATVGMFLWGRWRHDMVAAGALLACVLAGLVAPAEAFSGFGHPAVVTVACVLVLSRGLQSSGAVDVLAARLLPAKAGMVASLAALVGLGALLSGFMNNVGAMALLMPVAMQLAGRLSLPPGRVLMPLAFGTILGGMTTMIGTPPNLIVSGFRAQQGTGSFAMFDFTPIGLAVALGGILFIVLLGWRLVPAREKASTEGFETGAYVTEVRVLPDSKAAGLLLREIERTLDGADAQVIGLVRNEVRMNAPQSGRRVLAGDILVIEAEVDALPEVLSTLGLKLEEAGSSSAEDETGQEDKDEKNHGRDKAGEKAGHKAEHKAGSAGEDAEAEAEKSPQDDEITLMELVVRPEAGLIGRSAKDLLLRTRYGLNLLAVSREGARSKARLRTLKIQAGDLLLMQGPLEALSEFAADSGCVPLARRELRIPDRGKAWVAGLVMAFAVGGAALGLLPAAISFALGVLASMALRTVPLRAVYESIDWPVIVLLGALIPVAGAMESTGSANLIARALLEGVARGDAIVGLSLVLVVTMFLSDLMNNAATAAVMCPIAIGTATALGVSADPFLMAVAIGASCAFLTPIGHQNNTLILGPGGFRFGDYWRLGLPLELLVVAISVPMLLLVWPLRG
ncbi:MAG: anion permease [Thauera sp.]|jgi:di/tricarboxylate transporter|uniref:SLC13 family permease n=1 Tax=Thauera sp. ZXT1-4 TaxID=3460294 RepID=UPI001B6B8EB7|nr:anion permease [Thauera sp.]MBP6796946.1 anion permease [Luteimonas sp.]MBP7441835.1 anion permease [Thauera sp.]MBP8216307.1 anion permease [Thauera sp.]